ncbi:MAG TPA: ABC transporter permease [Chryseolinea sp.]
MFWINLKFAFRFWIKEKLYASLNVGVLAIGFLLFILIYAFLHQERSYDTYHGNVSQKFRLEEKWNKNGLIQHKAPATGFLLPNLRKDYGEVRNGTSFVRPEGIDFVSYQSNRFATDRFIRADSTFFTFFNFDFIYGDPVTALTGKKKVVITESASKRIFGDTMPLGKMLTRSHEDWEVTGVIKDMPENSHFHFDYVFTNSFISIDFQSNNMFYTYIELHEDVDVDKFAEKVNHDLPKSYGYDMKLRDDTKCDIIFKPLTEIHLNGDAADRELEKNSNKVLEYSLLVILVCVLLMTTINYISLSTALFIKRAKWVGINKISGAGKAIIFAGTLAKSFAAAFIALIISILLTLLILPGFNDYFNIALKVSNVFNPELDLLILLAYVTISLLAGLYPAISLSKVEALKSLKAKLTASTNARKPRLTFQRSLLLTQYMVTAVAVFCTLSVSKHLRFVREKNIGLTKENILVIPVPDQIIAGRDSYEKNDPENYNFFKSELLKKSAVLEAATMYSIPGQRIPLLKFAFPRLTSIGAVHPTEPEGGIYLKTMVGDTSMLRLFNMQLVQGRGFKRKPDDNMAAEFVVNEAAVKFLGTKDPIGERMELQSVYQHQRRSGTIVGVVKDFNYGSLQEAVEPIIMFNGFVDKYLVVKLSGNNDNVQTVSDIKSLWASLFDVPIDPYFLGDAYERMYRSDVLIQKFSTICMIFSVAIGTLCLLVITLFIVSQRKAEIGIRKVLGANGFNIWTLLSREFVILVVMGNLLAAIPSVLFMTNYFENYVFQEGINPFLYLAVFAFSVALTLVIVSIGIVKPLVANPVESISTGE